jgi:methyl-accepting chemotaxis protein
MLAIRDISDYLNEEMLNDIALDGLCELIPGTLTGLGILGTFVGLTMGISGINRNGEVSEISAGIDTLLSGMSTAFITSIVGVSLSILFSVLYKLAYRYTTDKMEFFLGIFHEKKLDHAEDQPVSKLLGYQQKQTELMDSFADRVSAAVSESMERAFVPVFHRLEDTIEKFGSFAAAQQQEGLEKIVQQFIQSMNESLGSQFEELGKTIELVCEWQKKSLKEMEQIVDGICNTSQEIERINDISRQTIHELESYTLKLNEMQEQINQSMQAVQERMDTVNEISREQEAYIQKLVDYQRETAELVNLVKEQAEQSAKAVDILAQNCQEQIDKLSDSAKQDMLVLADTTKALAETSHEQIQSISSVAQEQMEMLSETSAQLAEDNHQQLQQLAEVSSQQMDILSKTASTVLENSQQQLEDAVATAQEQTESMIQITNDYVEFVQSQQGLLVEAVKGEVGALAGFAGQTTDEIRKATEAMDNAAKLLDQNMDEALSRTFEAFDSNLASITEHLSGTIAEVRDTTEAVPYLIRQSQREYSKILEQLSEQTQQYNETIKQATNQMKKISGGQ